MQLAWLEAIGRIRTELERTKAAPGSPQAEKVVASQMGAWFQGEWVQTMVVSGARAGEELRKLGVNVAFDGTYRTTIEALQSHRVRLVHGFTVEQTQLTVNAVHQGQLAGANPIETAREFRNSIGLAPKQADAVRNYRRLLETQDRAALQRTLRDRRFDPTVNNAVSNGVPLTPTQITKMVDRYRDRMIKHRSEVIARTESLRALNTGQDVMYKQALDEGALEKDEVEFEWFTARDERVRVSHRVMHGQRRKQGEPFVTGNGALVLYPCDPDGPAEDTIQCRCTRVPRHRLFAQFHERKEFSLRENDPKPVWPAARKSVADMVADVCKALAKFDDSRSPKHTLTTPG